MGRVSRSMPACLLELTPRGGCGEIDARIREQRETTVALGHPLKLVQNTIKVHSDLIKYDFEM